VSVLAPLAVVLRDSVYLQIPAKLSRPVLVTRLPKTTAALLTLLAALMASVFLLLLASVFNPVLKTELPVTTAAPRIQPVA
jgi:hypothetical protein